MIVSHKHKYIFIKPQKTAGTSVELLLSRICGSEDIITPLGFDPDPNVREKHDARPPQNYFRPKPFKHWQMNELFWLIAKGRRPNLNYWEHLPADKIRAYVGNSIWSDYYKISLVRNPWDHAVSMFDWMSYYGYEKVDEMNFERFIHLVYKPQWPFLSIKGLFDLDFVIRFESLAEDIDKLQNRFPMLRNKTLPVTKINTRKSDSYEERYNYKTIELIKERNLNLIHKFNYSYK